MWTVHIREKRAPAVDKESVLVALLTDSGRITSAGQALIYRAHTNGWFFVCTCQEPAVRMTPVCLPSGKYTIRNLDEHHTDCPLHTTLGEGGERYGSSDEHQQIAAGGDRPGLLTAQQTARWLTDEAGRGSTRQVVRLPALAVLVRRLLEKSFTNFYVPYAPQKSLAALLLGIKKAGSAFLLDDAPVDRVLAYGLDRLEAWRAGERSRPMTVWYDVVDGVSRDNELLVIHGMAIECDEVWTYGELQGSETVLVTLLLLEGRERAAIAVVYPVLQTTRALLPYRSAEERAVLHACLMTASREPLTFVERPLSPRWDADLSTVVLPPVAVVTRKDQETGHKRRCAVWLGNQPRDATAFADEHIRVGLGERTMDRLTERVDKELSRTS